jgi:hypothetical protein
MQPPWSGGDQRYCGPPKKNTGQLQKFTFYLLLEGGGIAYAEREQWRAPMRGMLAPLSRPAHVRRLLQLN